ncbi:unnamed protein product, partial [Gadus morhua 'NCC']
MNLFAYNTHDVETPVCGGSCPLAVALTFSRCDRSPPPRAVTEDAARNLPIMHLDYVPILGKVAPLITQRSDVQNACIPANYRQTNEDGDTKTLDETQPPLSLSSQLQPPKKHLMGLHMAPSVRPQSHMAACLQLPPNISPETDWFGLCLRCFVPVQLGVSFFSSTWTDSKLADVERETIRMPECSRSTLQNQAMISVPLSRVCSGQRGPRGHSLTGPTYDTTLHPPLPPTLTSTPPSDTTLRPT